MNPEYLSRLLHRGDLDAGIVLLGLAVAFALGAMHALSPGHGKTIVAAYLVGTRGTVRHALLLGGVVTVTHTASVFALGLGAMFLSRYVLPDRIVPVLGLVSGAAIVWIGASLLYSRVRALRRPHRHDHHDHHHGHSHDHPHDHAHGEPVSTGSLIALGTSGGLVPCPSALVLLLSSITLGRAPLGMLLLAGFSVGLAVVLMAIGVLVIYARRLLPERSAASHPLFRYIPVVSALVILCVGLLMTAVAAGVVQPARFVG